MSKRTHIVDHRDGRDGKTYCGLTLKEGTKTSDLLEEEIDCQRCNRIDEIVSVANYRAEMIEAGLEHELNE